MSTNTLKLESKEHEILSVDHRLSSMSNLINNMVEDNPDSDEIIPLTQYSKGTLKLLIDFCTNADFKNENFVNKPILNPDNVFADQWE